MIYLNDAECGTEFRQQNINRHVLKLATGWYCFIYDSRQQIDTSFEAYMIVFCCKYPVYLVTGSDRQKTIDQIGLDICFRAESL